MITDREGLLMWMLSWGIRKPEAETMTDTLINKCPGIFSERLEEKAVLMELEHQAKTHGSFPDNTQEAYGFISTWRTLKKELAKAICSRFSPDRTKFIEREKVRTVMQSALTAIENMQAVQNGPPLIKWRQNWEYAMDLCNNSVNELKHFIESEGKCHSKI